METAKTPTTSTMLLLLLWVLLCGATIGSPMDKRELQMLEMMRSILGVDSSDIGGRSQRANPMLFANSVPCEDSLPDESMDNLSMFEDELDESVECGDFGRACDEQTQPETESETETELQPCPRPLLPMDHPCFVRVILLRTPMLRHDPCKNFTLAAVHPTTTTTTSSTTSTTPKPKTKKCKSKKKKTIAAVNNNSTTSSTTTTSPATTTSTTTTTQTTTLPIEIESTTTTPADNSTQNINSTATEADSTTTELITTTTLPITTTVLYTKNQLKSYRYNFTADGDQTTTKSPKNKRKGSKKGSRVPDAPKIKLDGAMQPSDTHSVVLATEMDELKSRQLVTTLPPPETTTPADIETTTDCVEDSTDMETSLEYDLKQAEGKQIPEISTTSEDCDDAEDQNTNLCPQFSAPEDSPNMRLMPGARYRKPVKNYVEPILYEGQFAKPRQRIGMLQPQRRDFYVSNKQIMPRPRPKYREPVPHSIYMNNIVRGLKCSDEVGQLSHPPQPRHYRTGKPTSGQRLWLPRRHGPGYVRVGSQPPMHGHQRTRDHPVYALSSAEDVDSYAHDSDQFYDDGPNEQLAWSREQLLGTAMPSVDPCQAEHRLDRERERQKERQLERQREGDDRDRENDHHLDYPQHVQPRFFT